MNKKVIEGHPNYSITDCGKVFNNTTGKVLKPFMYDGYGRVDLLGVGIRSKTYRIHRLVAIHFIDNPHNKPSVNHIDGNKVNNHHSNLEWCTPFENTNHAIKIGLINPKTRNNKPILQFDLNGNFIKEWCSAKTASIELGIYPQHISVVASDRPYRRQAGGFKWKWKTKDQVIPILSP